MGRDSLEWTKTAECVTSGEDPELWFSRDFTLQKIAKEHCLRCPVIEICHDRVMQERWFNDGVWAGMTPAERRRYARAQQIPLNTWR